MNYLLILSFNPFMHDVENWSKIPKKPCGVKLVWLFFKVYLFA